MLALIGDMNGPALWRILSPLTALERAGYPCGWDRVGNPALTDAFAGRFDGLIIARMSWPTAWRDRAVRWFGLARARGQVVVYDCDDDIFSTAMTRHALGAGLSHDKSFRQLEDERHDSLWAMRMCDGVTVSTEPLAEVVRGFTERPVLVVPNAIDVPWFRSVVGHAQGRSGPSGDVRLSPTTIGWAGGQRDEADLAEVAEAWRRIAAGHPSVRFVVAGHRSALLTRAVPAERLVYRPWLAVDRYPANLRGLDVGCCAVTASAFNRAKSAIKAWEYALAGAAVVATPTVYGDTIEHGQSGYLAATADEWEWALDQLVTRPAHRAMLARRLVRRVEREWSLAANLAKWPAAWQAIAEHARSRRGSVVVA